MSKTDVGTTFSCIQRICKMLCTFEFRDADETKDWIDEKENTLNSPDFGHDLATVQRLQRKHEGLERDLAAIGEKVKDLDDTAQRLMQTHPDQAQSIYDHQREINDQWNALTQKADNRKAKLLDSYDLQRFLGDFRYAIFHMCFIHT